MEEKKVDRTTYIRKKEKRKKEKKNERKNERKKEVKIKGNGDE